MAHKIVLKKKEAIMYVAGAQKEAHYLIVLEEPWRSKWAFLGACPITLLASNIVHFRV